MLISPLKCPLQMGGRGFRLYEARTKKGRGQTLFLHHPTLVKWDWDIPDPAHSASAVTITRRKAALAWISASPWASAQAWGITASWGGVNAYLLSKPMDLSLMTAEEGEILKDQMVRCHVDPHYIKNVDGGLQGRWSWCSRVYPKTWRPEETWTGVFMGVWNPSKASIDAQLWKEFEFVNRCYQVFSQGAPPVKTLW